MSDPGLLQHGKIAVKFLRPPDKLLGKNSPQLLFLFLGQNRRRLQTNPFADDNILSGFICLVVSNSFFLILPTPVTEINGCVTTCVTSVCPPSISIFSCPQVRSTSCIILRISGSSTPSGSITVSIIPTGSAPEAARSLAVMWMQ